MARQHVLAQKGLAEAESWTWAQVRGQSLASPPFRHLPAWQQEGSDAEQSGGQKVLEPVSPAGGGAWEPPLHSRPH